MLSCSLFSNWILVNLSITFLCCGSGSFCSVVLAFVTSVLISYSVGSVFNNDQPFCTIVLCFVTSVLISLTMRFCYLSIERCSCPLVL